MKSIRCICYSIAAALLLTSCSLFSPSPPVSAPPQRVPAPQPKPQPAPQPQPPPRPLPPATTPPPRESPAPSPSAVKQYQLGAAAKALVAQAQSQVAARDYSMAVSTVERALRIEPANPLLWIELGKVHQAAKNYAQAESTARKALSLASADLRAQAAAWQLIAQSFRARGREQDAQDADERAYALMPD